MWDYLFDPNSNNSPLEQRVFLQAHLHTWKTIFTPGRHMLHRDPLHCVGDRTPYVKHSLQSHLFTGFAGHVLREAGLLLSILRAQLALHGLLLRLFCSLGIEQVLSSPQTKSLGLTAS